MGLVLNLWKMGIEKEKKGKREEEREGLRDRGRIACDDSECIVDNTVAANPDYYFFTKKRKRKRKKKEIFPN